METSRPGKHLPELTFPAYSPDNRLCPIVHLAEYVKRTSQLRKGSDQLLLSFQKPHKPVSTDTISRRLRTVLKKSGKDVSAFKGHSIRPASTSEQLKCARSLCLQLWIMQADRMPQPLASSTKNPLSQLGKPMVSFCWRISIPKLAFATRGAYVRGSFVMFLETILGKQYCNPFSVPHVSFDGFCLIKADHS